MEKGNQKPALGRKISIERYRESTGVEKTQDFIPSELLLSISLNSKTISLVSCSPGNLVELTIGYLINNGYVGSYADILLVNLCSEQAGIYSQKNDFSAKVEVTAKIPEKQEAGYGGLKIISSSCGSLDDFMLKADPGRITSRIKVNSEILLSLNKKVLGMQEMKKEFGGLHSAALFNASGTLVRMSEDIVRHNCIDKLAGFMSINRLQTSDKIIFTTGRLSLDVIYKAVRMNIPFIVSNSSVTYSAAALARKTGITAAGYARSGRFNLYSCPWRII